MPPPYEWSSYSKTRARSEKTLQKLSCGMQKPKKGGNKGWELLKMVLCYLNFIQPYCVLRYLVSHTSSDCTSVSVAQNHLEYSSTKIMCERILHMRGKTANREKTLQKFSENETRSISASTRSDTAPSFALPRPHCKCRHRRILLSNNPTSCSS